MDLLLSVGLGAALGVMTGILPGLHVNTLAAVAFAVQPDAGPNGAAFLLAVGTVHTIVNILPATYLGAPDEDDVIGVLPAHRLLLAGRGPDAVAISVAASLGGIMLAVLLVIGLRAVWSASIAGHVDVLTPWVLIGVVVVLWLQETRRGVRAGIAAVAVSILAGATGLFSTMVPIRPILAVTASPLLPLLGGLFGAAGLSVALQRPPHIPHQHGLTRRIRRPVPVLIGGFIATGTALMPGLTASVATAMVPGIRGRPLHAVAAMSAINSAHTIIALGVLLVTGRIRTGLADAVDQWVPIQWPGGLPIGVAALLVIVLVAAVIGGVATLAIDRMLRPVVDRLPSVWLAGAALSFLTGLVILLCGLGGLVLFALAMAVGRLPIHWGVRRVHLVACLIAPVLMWQ